MMKISINIAGFLLLSVTSFSQDTSAVSSSLLWEIKGKKVVSPSYIMGTMHLIPKERFLFPDHLENKVRESELLVMEIGGVAEEKVNIVQYMMLDTGNVFNFFSERQLDSLFEYTEAELGYSEEQMRLMFSIMKPLVIMQLFTSKGFGETPESYELTFERIAKADSIPIEGLETVEDQVAIFDKIPVQDQVEMLMSTVRQDTLEAREMQSQLISIFLSQNIDSIYQYTQGDREKSDFEQDLLVNRNENWIPVIKKLIKRKRCFIAVGAAHLGGPEGVIQLLREEGYELIPVKL